MAHARRSLLMREGIGSIGWALSERETHIWVCRYCDNLKKCSCWMCNRRRKRDGPNRQELRMNQRA